MQRSTEFLEIQEVNREFSFWIFSLMIKRIIFIDIIIAYSVLDPFQGFYLPVQQTYLQQKM